MMIPKEINFILSTCTVKHKLRKCRKKMRAPRDLYRENKTYKPERLLRAVNSKPSNLKLLFKVHLLLAENRKEIECVRSCDQNPYLHNETKGGICIKIEFNPQKNISLLQHGRRFFVYSSNMAAVTSCEHTLLTENSWTRR